MKSIRNEGGVPRYRRLGRRHWFSFWHRFPGHIRSAQERAGEADNRNVFQTCVTNIRQRDRLRAGSADVFKRKAVERFLFRDFGGLQQNRGVIHVYSLKQNVPKEWYAEQARDGIGVLNTCARLADLQEALSHVGCLEIAHADVLPRRC